MSESEVNEETLALIRWQQENPNVWGDQDENGVDLARLRENLRLTPVERLQHMDRGRQTLRWMQNARKRQSIR